MKFRELVETVYIAHGFTKTNALAKVVLESGVSKSSAESAFDGWRVLPETARDLEVWAKRLHKVGLDLDALLMAPCRKPRKRAA